MNKLRSIFIYLTRIKISLKPVFSKKILNIRVPLLVMLSLICFNGFSNVYGFEGVLKIEKTNHFDTVLYTFQVKGNKVHIDEFNISHNSHITYIADLENGSIIAINPQLKVYRPVEVNNLKPVDLNNYEIIKSENIREINGKQCYQWRVRNKKLNTEIAYWVVKDGFHFYQRLASIFNNIEKLNQFFLAIPDSEGVMPMLVIERSNLRDEKSRMAVTQFVEQKVKEDIFRIPSNFRPVN